GVEFVIRVEDERNIERSSCGVAGDFPVQHVQEVAGMRKRTVGFDEWQALPNAIVSGNNHRDLCGNAKRLVEIGGCVVRLLFRIEEGQCRDDGPQHVHREGVLGNLADEADNLGVELTLTRKLKTKFL